MKKYLLSLITIRLDPIAAFLALTGWSRLRQTFYALVNTIVHSMGGLLQRPNGTSLCVTIGSEAYGEAAIHSCFIPYDHKHRKHNASYNRSISNRKERSYEK